MNVEEFFERLWKQLESFFSSFSMSRELVVIIAAILIALLVFTWLLKVFKASISTALTIAIILLILQVVFGIRSQEIWEYFEQFLKEASQTLYNPLVSLCLCGSLSIFYH